MKIEIELLAEKSTSRDNNLCDDSVIGNNISESGEATKDQLKIYVEDDDITVTVNEDFFKVVLAFLLRRIKIDESVKVQINKEIMTLPFKKK
ncbi:22205_t:CDS:2, partial [Entrophospora sp. SA101]